MKIRVLVINKQGFGVEEYDALSLSIVSNKIRVTVSTSPSEYYDFDPDDYMIATIGVIE